MLLSAMASADFSPDLFLDPALAESTSTDLLQEADYIRYQSSHAALP